MDEDMRVINTLPNASLVQFQDDFYYVGNELKLSTSDYFAIKDTFGLKQVEPNKNGIPLNFSEIKHIVRTAKIVTLTADMQEITNTITRYYVIVSESLPTQLTDKNTDKIIFNNKASPIKDALNKQIKTTTGTWKVIDIVGVGRHSAAFKVKLIKPSIRGAFSYLFGKTIRIAKFRKTDGLNLFFRNLMENTNKSPIEQSSAIKSIAGQIDKEQVKINNSAGLASIRIKSGGIVESLRTGITLTKWLESNSKKHKKKAEIIVKLAISIHDLHKKNIAHNDLNTDNIIIKENSRGQLSVKLIDFGNSSIINKQTRITAAIEEINTDRINVKQSGHRIKLSTTSPKNDKNMFKKDLLDLNILARSALGLKKDLISNNFNQSIRMLITSYARMQTSLELAKNPGAKPMKSDDELFWKDLKQIAKASADPQFKQDAQELQIMYKKALATTKPKAVGRADAILTSAILLTACAFAAELTLQFLDSSFAINRNYTNIATHLIVLIGILSFLSIAIHKASNTQNIIPNNTPLARSSHNLISFKDIWEQPGQNSPHVARKIDFTKESGV